MKTQIKYDRIFKKRITQTYCFEGYEIHENSIIEITERYDDLYLCFFMGIWFYAPCNIFESI